MTSFDDDEWFRVQCKLTRGPLDPNYTKFSTRSLEVGRAAVLFWYPTLPAQAWSAFFVFDLFDRRGLPGVKQWCTEQFGPSLPSQGGRWHMREDMIAFMDEADGFAFRLRWC
jgi:hypothetical protein